MYKATREFIKARQPYATFTVQHVNGIRKVGGGVDGRCFDNSQKQIDHEKGISIVSGWIVNKYDSRGNLSAIIQHWWNADKDGFFDTSDVADHYEYVIDMDLAQYVGENNDNLDSRVAYSLKLVDGKFSLIDIVDEKITDVPIQNLRTPILFKHTQTK